MKLERNGMEIEIVDTYENKRPSLMILQDRNLHSKVGMMMDMERAKEFYEYLKRFIGENCQD